MADRPTRAPEPSREASILASRAIITAAVAASFGLYWVTPSGAGWWVEILARTYLHFVLGVMAHEGTHGHLGKDRASNQWWARLSLLPTTVPWICFRKTHLEHHRFTNVPGRDPDAFLDTPHRWQVPFRAVAMPHQWLFWLRRKGQLRRGEVIDYLATYLTYAVIYGGIIASVGAERFFLGLIPATLLHSLLLWYPFAIQTHAGYSQGTAEARSHNYDGILLFWFSFGLSLHRVHHLQPQLAWLQMTSRLPPVSWRSLFTFRRDIRLDPRSAR